MAEGGEDGKSSKQRRLTKFYLSRENTKSPQIAGEGCNLGRRGEEKRICKFSYLIRNQKEQQQQPKETCWLKIAQKHREEEVKRSRMRMISFGKPQRKLLGEEEEKEERHSPQLYRVLDDELPTELSRVRV